MPGPAPKNQQTRQRRNKVVTRANLAVEENRGERVPQLPKDVAWHAMTKRWWRDVWHSPMASEYLEADLHALVRLAILINMFWLKPSPKLAGEIRLQQQAFGLTPLDRRRLEWNIEQVEEAKDRREIKRIKRAVVINGDDPRDILK